jgi:vacuolar-type H+-ATPase subunit I/STV1
MQIAFIRYSVVKADKLDDQVTKVMNDLRVLDAEVRVRDSMLVKSIESSYKKIEELTEIRKMNQKQIDSLKLEIESDLDVIDEYKKDMLTW